MVGLVYCPTNLLFFGIPLLYYYISFKSLIIFYLSSGDTYVYILFLVFFIILICNCFWMILLWNFWNPLILLAISLPVNCFCCFLIFHNYQYYQIINNFLPFFWRYIYIYISFGISSSFSFVTVSELFCYKFFETFVMLSAILLAMRIISCCIFKLLFLMHF